MLPKNGFGPLQDDILGRFILQVFQQCSNTSFPCSNTCCSNTSNPVLTPPLSTLLSVLTLEQKPWLRLLAWLVADAMSADQPLDKRVALTVGKRLDRQCQKVRADLARVSADAEQTRRNLQDAASLTQLRSAGPADADAALPDRLASISTSEHEQLDKLQYEVYI